MVYRIALNQTRRVPDAEDVVQAVFLKLYENRRRGSNVMAILIPGAMPATVAAVTASALQGTELVAIPSEQAPSTSACARGSSASR